MHLRKGKSINSMRHLRVFLAVWDKPWEASPWIPALSLGLVREKQRSGGPTEGSVCFHRLNWVHKWFSAQPQWHRTEQETASYPKCTAGTEIQAQPKISGCQQKSQHTPWKNKPGMAQQQRRMQVGLIVIVLRASTNTHPIKPWM